MPYLRHALGTTYYETRGRDHATRRPLLFLHGGPGGHSLGLRRLFPLADERRVVIYDQLGAGNSRAKGTPKWSIPLFVRELETLVDRLGLDDFHLGGGSWGTTLALEYYLRRRGRGVRSLTFLSPLFSTRVWADDANRLLRTLPAKVQDVIRACQRVGATDAKVYKEAEKEFNRRFVLRVPEPPAPKKPRPRNYDIYETMWGPSEFHPTGTLKNYDRIADLAKIRVPARILCGQYDEATPASGRRFARRIPDGTFVELKGCSHRSLVENPKVVLDELRRWYSAVETRR